MGYAFLAPSGKASHCSLRHGQEKGISGQYRQDCGGASFQPEQTVLWHGAYRDQTGRDPADHNRIVCIRDEPL